jgi:hypothetical protein
MRFLSLTCWGFGICALAAGGSWAANDSRASAEEPVVVHLLDGRILEAEVDARTDDELLWLEFTAPGIILRSAVPWGEVAAVWRAGERLSAAELRRQAEQPTTAPPDDSSSSAAAEWAERGQDAKNQKRTSGARSEHEFGWTAAAGDVQSLQVAAAVSNWDADAEVDGLEVRVRPISASGSLTPVEGLLQVRLMGQRTNGADRQRGFGELARWSRSVRSQDFSRDGAICQLPFRTMRPEVDLDVRSEALVHVRLSAPGQGVFQASTPVRIRTYSLLRDLLQLHEGVRFFVGE